MGSGHRDDSVRGFCGRLTRRITRWPRPRPRRSRQPSRYTTIGDSTGEPEASRRQGRTPTETRPRDLQAAQRRRTILQLAQTVARPGHPLRQACRDLPRRSGPGGDHHLAAKFLSQPSFRCSAANRGGAPRHLARLERAATLSRNGHATPRPACLGQYRDHATQQGSPNSTPMGLTLLRELGVGRRGLDALGACGAWSAGETPGRHSCRPARGDRGGEADRRAGRSSPRPAPRHPLPQIVDIMLGTGLRIGSARRCGRRTSTSTPRSRGSR